MSSLHERPLQRYRIVFVDDESTLVQVAAISLERQGFEVYPTTSVAGAIQMFKIAPDFYDLFLIDEVMPDLLGHELADRLRSIRPTLPIILVTGNNWLMSQQEAQTRGFGYLVKPHTTEELRTAIETILTTEGHLAHRSEDHYSEQFI